jgi:antitoxin component YwqK of YwqJK toxin-antitoxin module
MCRIFFLTLYFFFCIVFSGAQNTLQPVKFTHENKQYFVYPVRAGNINGIPPTGFNCPDGDYILFFDYEFRSRLLKNELSLKDTTKISAVFSIKNNLPNGTAVFYGYDFTSFYSGTISGTATTEEEGNFENGLKEGKWIKKMVNSKWAKSHPDANKTICYYSRGLLNGQWTEYDNYGNLQKTEKYKNDRLADTVSFYANGKIILQYDIYDALLDTAPVRPDNFYDFIINKNEHFQVLGSESLINTFYKTWDENGKPINYVKYKNGKNPFFDTLQLNPSEKLIIKSLSEQESENKYSVKLITDSWNGTKTTEELYKGREVYFSSTVTYNKKTKAADSVAFSIADVQLPGKTSWNDIVWAEKYTNGIKTLLHIVPAIGYTWEEIHYLKGQKKGMVYLKQKPLSIDSSLQIVHTVDTFSYFPSAIKKIQEIDFKSEEAIKKNLASGAGFYIYNFLSAVPLLNFQNHFSETSSGLFHSTDRGLDSKWKSLSENYFGFENSAVFVKNGEALNGKIILTNNKKLSGKKKFEVKPVFTNTIYYTLMRFELLNGKRNGTFEFLKKNKISGAKNNFEASFFNHPKNKDSYIIAHFSDGELNGNLKEYKAEKKVFLETGNSSENSIVENKVRTYLYCDVNYSNGRLNGSYKTFYINSNPKIIATLKNGLPQGLFENYYENGKISVRCYLKDGGFDGDYSEYNELGVKTIEARFENNSLQGNYTEFFANGESALKIEAQNNILKTRKLFFADRSLQEELIFTESSKAEFCFAFTGTGNFIERLLQKRISVVRGEKMFASYKSFYENGNVLCEGKISEGKPAGNWKFYNVAGTLINEVVFKDTSILFAGSVLPKQFAGTITGYFNNGEKRCTGYVLSWETGYDCTVHQDKTKFSIVVENAWTFEGKQVMINGTGAGTLYDENGSKISTGQLISYKPEGIWKFYDPNQKINATGKFINGEKDGLWYSGDLENLNFEDGACFDPADKAAKQKIEYNKSVLRFRTEIYRNGTLLESENFESDLNKNRKKEN